MLRAVLLAACIAIGLLPVLAGRAAAQLPAFRAASTARGWHGVSDDTTTRPVIVDIRIGSGSERTVEAMRRGERALLPVRAVLETAEVRVLAEERGTIHARLEPGAVPFRLHRGGIDTTALLAVGGRARPLGERDIAQHDGELLVDAAILAEALGVLVELDWASMMVSFNDHHGRLPRTRRLQRELALGRLLARGSIGPDDALYQRQRAPLWDGGALDYAAHLPLDLRGTSSFGTALGMNVGGGALDVSTTLTGAQPVGADVEPRTWQSRTIASWTGAWSERPYLRHLRLGNGLSTGPRPRLLRGIAFGNAPPSNDHALGTLEEVGSLGPGWQVEVYRAGELVAIDTADALGRYAVPITMHYGDNPMELVAYGPHGEVRRLPRLVRVPQALVPRHTLEYGVSLGECEQRSCRSTVNADVRYGAATGWTARAGVEGFWRDTLPAVHHPYAELTGLLTRSTGMQLELVHDAFTRARGWYEPSQDLRVTAEWTGFAPPHESVPPSASSSPLVPAGRRAQWMLTGLARPGGVLAHGGAMVEGQLVRQELTGGAQTSARVGMWTSAAGMQLFPSVRTQTTAIAGAASHRQTSFGLATLALARPRSGAARLFSGTALRLTAEASPDDGLEMLSATAARTIVTGARAELGIHRHAGAPGTTLTFAVTTDRAWLRSHTTVTQRPGASTTGTQYLQGSVLLDRATGDLSLSAGPSTTRAGVAGRVFLDLDGDGVQGNDEPPIAGALVRIGMHGARTDAEGRYAVWDLRAHDLVRVMVDSASLPTPLWIPAQRATAVATLPNRYRALDLAVVPAGMVEGRVEQALDDGSAVPVASVDVALVRIEHGKAVGTIRRVRTFSDGGFLALGIPPGEYSVQVRPPPGWESEADQAITVRPRADGDEVSGVVIRVRRVVD